MSGFLSARRRRGRFSLRYRCPGAVIIRPALHRGFFDEPGQKGPGRAVMDAAVFGHRLDDPGRGQPLAGMIPQNPDDMPFGLGN